MTMIVLTARYGNWALWLTVTLVAVIVCSSSPAATTNDGSGGGIPEGDDDGDRERGATQEELTAALAAAFGSAGMTITTVSGTKGGVEALNTPLLSAAYASGRKYDLVIEWERPLLDWSKKDRADAQERAHSTTMSRVMATPDGTQWRCEIPIPKHLMEAASGLEARGSGDSDGGDSDGSSSSSGKNGEIGGIGSNNGASSSSVPRADADDAANAAILASIASAGVELLKPLHGVCLRKPEGWWTYEVCMGKHIRQYHAERKPDPNGEDGDFINVEVSEFILGKFDAAAEIKAKPPSLLQKFTSGTQCDLIHKPRSATLEFLCQPNSKYNSFIEEIEEVSTCEYHVKLRTPLLCENPAFVAAKVTEAGESISQSANKITCVPFVDVNKASNVFFSDSGKIFTEQPDVVSTEAEDTAGDIDSVSGVLEVNPEELLAAVQELLNQNN